MGNQWNMFIFTNLVNKSSIIVPNILESLHYVIWNVIQHNFPAVQVTCDKRVDEGLGGIFGDKCPDFFLDCKDFCRQYHIFYNVRWHGHVIFKECSKIPEVANHTYWCITNNCAFHVKFHKFGLVPNTMKSVFKWVAPVCLNDAYILWLSAYSGYHITWITWVQCMIPEVPNTSN